MNVLLILIPLALVLVSTAIAAFVWAVRNGQFDDPDRAASQVLFEDDEP